MLRNEMKLTHGRLAMTDAEAALLAEICREPGDHVEIGALWGATSIIAATNKPLPWMCYSIDLMRRSYWETGDPGMPDRAMPSAQKILENWQEAGLSGRICLICAPSNPLPLPHYVQPSTALIDGSHMLANVIADWQNVSAITSRFVALHDVGEHHPDVRKAVDGLIVHEPAWRAYKQADSLLVMERRA